MKYCGRCKKEKDFSEFGKRAMSKDKLQAWCKPCLNKSNQEQALKRKANGPTIVRISKVCHTCGLKKPITQFHVKRGYSADGYGSYCKPCWTIRVTRNRARLKARVSNG